MGDLLLRRRAPMMAKAGGGGEELPDDYQRVEYLYGSGPHWAGQPWLDIGEYPTLSTVVQIRFMFKSGGYVFVDNIDNGKFLAQSYQQKIKFLDNWFRGEICPNEVQLNMEFGNRYIKDLQTDSIIESVQELSSLPQRGVLKFFYYSWAGFWIYYIKIFNGSLKTHDLVPCYRKSDLKPGMYDLVSGEFFVNQGGGEFVLGPNVN